MTLPRVARIRDAGEKDGDLVRFANLTPTEALDLDVPLTGEFLAMLLRDSPYLLDAADALDNLHLRICGCDSPGKLSYCSFDDFAALVPLQVDG